MVKKNIKIISIVLVMILIILSATTVFAVNPDDYQITDTGDTGGFISKAGIILRWVQVIGFIVAVIVLAVIAIKYIFASVEGKAKYKQTLIPYLIGCLLLVGTPTVLILVADIADDTGTSSPRQTQVTYVETDSAMLRVIQAINAGDISLASDYDIGYTYYYAEGIYHNTNYNLYTRQKYRDYFDKISAEKTARGI